MSDKKQKKEKKSTKERSAAGPAENFNKNVRFTNKVIKEGLRTVSSHHIDAFDYAMDKCMPRICKYMLPLSSKAAV